MAKYPSPGEKVRVGDLEEAATAMKNKAQECHRQAKQACEGFESEAKAIVLASSGEFNRLAKAVMRSRGEELMGELDGPAWVKFDALTGYHLGIAKLASSQSIQRIEAGQAYQEIAKSEDRIHSRVGLAQSTAFNAAKAAAAAKGGQLLAIKDFKPHEGDYADFFSGNEKLDAQQLDRKHSEVGFIQKLFGTQGAKNAQRWARARDSGVGHRALAERVQAAGRAWKGAEAALALAEAERSKAEEAFREMSEKKALARQPHPWIDAGSRVPASTVHAMATKDSATIEAIATALIAKMPSARVAARNCLKDGLTIAAMNMVVSGLDKERSNLSSLVSNLDSMATKMGKARRKSSSDKGSVKFDLNELASKLDQRKAQLSGLAKDGPKAAVARIAAMAWGDEAAIKGFSIDAKEAKELQKAAESKFGAASAPAKAISSMRARAKEQSQSQTTVAGQDDASMVSSWFWCSMLTSRPHSIDAGVLASPGSFGADSGSSLPSFDFGSVGLSVGSSFDSGSGSSWDSSPSASSFDSGGSGSFSSCASSSGSSSSCSSSSSSCSSGSSCGSSCGSS